MESTQKNNTVKELFERLKREKTDSEMQAASVSIINKTLSIFAVSKGKAGLDCENMK